MPESSPKNEIREKLLKYAVNILSGRPYFKHTLKQKLFFRAERDSLGDASHEIDQIITDLDKGGYLNDAYLAEALIRRQLSKGYGPKIISLKLKYLGLGRELIATGLKQEASEESELQAIKKYCQKYPRLDQRKLVSKLYLRGFTGTVIRKVFDSDRFED